jgi:hypothetical protein
MACYQYNPYCSQWRPPGERRGRWCYGAMVLWCCGAMAAADLQEEAAEVEVVVAEERSVLHVALHSAASMQRGTPTSNYCTTACKRP